MIHPVELIKPDPLTLLVPSPILKRPPTTAKPLHGKMQANKKKNS
jgi:hypothetical protein